MKINKGDILIIIKDRNERKEIGGPFLHNKFKKGDKFEILKIKNNILGGYIVYNNYKINQICELFIPYIINNKEHFKIDYQIKKKLNFLINETS